MVASLLVLPSPLVGSGAYAVLADAFRQLGVTTEVAEVPSEVTTGREVLEAFRQAVDALRPELVVAHSNAGLVAPAVADGIPTVFVDAALPPPHGACAMAPAAMLGHLEELAGPHGLLPPWTQWWPEDDVEPLFPDRSSRASAEAGLPTLPLAYFRSKVTAPAGWEDGPCAYLAFGQTYAAELGRARRLGWPAGEVAGALHLHFLHDPAQVAREVLDLAGRVNGGGGATSRV
ncbi:hypothetical protein LL946_13870 [Knoellia locipacati]|uniref:hypothetical protein n=1 Tax=Knoellia locipacati TaxID=882824 RepID=UPI003850B3C0